MFDWEPGGDVRVKRTRVSLTSRCRTARRCGRAGRWCKPRRSFPRAGRAPHAARRPRVPAGRRPRRDRGPRAGDRRTPRRGAGTDSGSARAPAGRARRRVRRGRAQSVSVPSGVMRRVHATRRHSRFGPSLGEILLRPHPHHLGAGAPRVALHRPGRSRRARRTTGSRRRASSARGRVAGPAPRSCRSRPASPRCRSVPPPRRRGRAAWSGSRASCRESD